MKLPTFHPCWLTIPSERSAAFLPAFVRMSVAIQCVLRERVPMEYFEDWGKYRDLKTAGPMLVYQASPPFRGKKRTELTYDVLKGRPESGIDIHAGPAFEAEARGTTGAGGNAAAR
jgi:hypothetical protein